MNRLKIVQKYMSVSVKINDIKRYRRAQILSKKISDIQDKKLYNK